MDILRWVLQDNEVDDFRSTANPGDNAGSQEPRPLWASSPAPPSSKEDLWTTAEMMLRARTTTDHCATSAVARLAPPPPPPPPLQAHTEGLDLAQRASARVCNGFGSKELEAAFRFEGAAHSISCARVAMCARLDASALDLSNPRRRLCTAALHSQALRRSQTIRYLSLSDEEWAGRMGWHGRTAPGPVSFCGSADTICLAEASRETYASLLAALPWTAHMSSVGFIRPPWNWRNRQHAAGRTFCVISAIAFVLRPR